MATSGRKSQSSFGHFVSYDNSAGLVVAWEIARFLSIYTIDNKTYSPIRLYKYMGGTIGPPKNTCSLWLHKIPFYLKTKKNISN